MTDKLKEGELERLQAAMAVSQKRAAEDRRTKVVDLPSLQIEVKKPSPLLAEPVKKLMKAPPKQDMEVSDHYHTRKHPSGLAASLENTILAIAELRIIARYDVFHNKVLFDSHPKLLPGEFEMVCLCIRQIIAHQKEFEPAKEAVIDAVTRIAMNYRFNPVLDYLDSLRWDGKPRIDTWLNVYCGADDNSLNRAIGRKFLLAAVRRVKQPGCKFDNIIVLESRQGTLKSTLARTLAGDENFSDADILASDKREQQELCEGVWIYEIAELSGLHKSEVEKVKAFASRQEDKARPAYGRKVEIRPRTCVFFGTTNDNEYLQDQTGNRRFWPVAIVRVDIEAVRRDRDQLFAEAVAAEAMGESLVLPEELWPDAEVRQESRVASDPWADRLGMLREDDDLESFAAGTPANIKAYPNESGILCWRISSEFILTGMLNIAPNLQTTAQSRKVAGIMRKFGWDSKDFRFDGKVGKGYWRKCRNQVM
jgi:predicted P-loop ATPase